MRYNRDGTVSVVQENGACFICPRRSILCSSGEGRGDDNCVPNAWASICAQHIAGYLNHVSRTWPRVAGRSEAKGRSLTKVWRALPQPSHVRLGHVRCRASFRFFHLASEAMTSWRQTLNMRFSQRRRYDTPTEERQWCRRGPDVLVLTNRVLHQGYSFVDRQDAVKS